MAKAKKKRVIKQEEKPWYRAQLAAWKTKPSWGIVAMEDKSIRPEIEEKMYTRSNTKFIKIKGSHAVYISQPEAVAKVIIEAAESVSKNN